MTYALVGSLGAVNQTAVNAANTPAWGTGESRGAGHLLLLWVGGHNSANLPGTPAGWSIAVQKAGTSCSVSIFYLIAVGGDVAPTVAANVSANWSTMLGEFSGNAVSPFDRSASAAGTVSPLVATAAGADVVGGELLVYCSGAIITAATETLSNTLNNGAVGGDVNNNSTSINRHYDFGWAITTGNGVADSDSFAFTGAPTGTAVVIASFLRAVALTPNVFLPRRLGPWAVGPTFFAAQPTATVGAASGGPAVLAASTSDTSLSTDSVGQVLGLARSSADTSLSSDAVTGAVALPRATADASLSTDAVTRGAQSFARSGANISTSTDSAVRAIVLPRSTADASLSSDTAAPAKGYARALADTSLSSDTAARALVLARSSIDTGQTSDVVTRILGTARSSADTSLTSDSATSGSGGNLVRSTVDTTLTTDTAIRSAAAFIRSASDTSITTTTSSRIVVFARAAVDTSATVDTATSIIRRSRTGADTSSTTDSATRLSQITVRFTTDISLATDMASRNNILGRTHGDSSLSSDTAGRVRGYVRFCSDTTLTTDLVTFAFVPNTGVTYPIGPAGFAGNTSIDGTIQVPTAQSGLGRVGTDPGVSNVPIGKTGTTSGAQTGTVQMIGYKP